MFWEPKAKHWTLGGMPSGLPHLQGLHCTLWETHSAPHLLLTAGPCQTCPRAAPGPAMDSCLEVRTGPPWSSQGSAGGALREELVSPLQRKDVGEVVVVPEAQTPPAPRSLHRCTSKQERSGSLWAFSNSAPYRDKHQSPSQCEEGHGCPACRAVGAAVGTGASGVLAMQPSLLSLPQRRCVDPSCSWEPRHDQPVVSWSSLQGGAFAV